MVIARLKGCGHCEAELVFAVSLVLWSQWCFLLTDLDFVSGSQCK